MPKGSSAGRTPYVFSLIHKFNKDVNPKEPYSERDDIIVSSDEAKRTQAGRLARNMRLALPNAAFVGFRGTPRCKQDESTKPGDDPMNTPTGAIACPYLWKN